MTPVLRNRLIGVAIAFAIYAADQLTKWWVDGPLGLEVPGDKLDLLPFFDFYRVHNYGVSLGMFEATSPETRWADTRPAGSVPTPVKSRSVVWLGFSDRWVVDPLP